MSAWWADPQILALLGPALADLHVLPSSSLVISPSATGFLLGPLTAIPLNAGFVEMRRDAANEKTNEDAFLLRSTPPDYLSRTITWQVRRRALRPGVPVLFVDDWVETAATARTARRLVVDSGAVWAGAAAIVDATSGQTRHELRLRTLLHHRELG
ncbi:adenine phosphoribosyltransferase [Streptacidiphilus sp. N1-10]|uniref:Adenine phosphoribosyltransferase n=1 Tax=Streptacidiphilus jeojiensis TaxID=3229225 RepID=A0ABV6XP40_9ACTN